MNPLQRLHEAGQSIWVDFLRRTFLTSGELSRLMREDAVSGITSNPTIFRRAVAESVDYEQPMQQLVEHGSRDPREIFYRMALTDIRAAAEVLRPVYVQTKGHDGFVSFELEPRLAHDTPGSVSVARHLAEHIVKPNLMIKVPGTSEGILAVEELTAAGVNVNITLLFSVATYEDVAEAYLAGLEHRLAAGQQLDRVASVASFFVSRVDSAIDGLLPEGSPLRGQVAIANAKQAYQRYLSVFSGARWDRLARAGARVQRPLWASTGTKNSAYSDVRYFEELIGPSTMNTMPLSTLDAFRDHGRVRPLTILADLDEAEAVFLLLREHGIPQGNGADYAFGGCLPAVQVEPFAKRPPIPASPHRRGCQGVSRRLRERIGAKSKPDRSACVCTASNEISQEEVTNGDSNGNSQR